MHLYLASTSPARLATLRAAGIEPTLIDPAVDEDAAVAAWVAVNGPITPERTVELLARAKAEAVVARFVEGRLSDAATGDGVSGDVVSGDGHTVDGFILGGDSVFELDGVVYGKPHRAEVARERWMLQRGRTGHLHSGHWLIDHRVGHPVRGVGAVSTAAVTFADDIGDDEIDAYIATGEPLKVAGAFTIDSLGAPFITSVSGDPHAVVGLSLATVRRMVTGFGGSWVDLWNR